MKGFIAALALIAISGSFVFAQNDTIKSYTTAFVVGEPPVVDGQVNEDAWEQVPWAGGDFRQLEPDKGKPASVQTKFKILYDAKNLYVLIRAFDPEPDKIGKRMARRDAFEGDLVEINLDTYFDKRTAFSFTASASGVKGEEYVSNNGDDWDPGWDPIWYLKTSIDAEGWIAEFRIPLSQLRFANKDELIWGVQVTRIFFRKQERSLWQYIPPDAGGWVHLFAELRGIKGVKPQKQFEIQPYVVLNAENFQREEGNPYKTGSSSDATFGLDAKIGITSDVTLDLSINPDFGQVEADPSQVNLTAFELFFEERRPFFIEGNNILNFPVSPFNSNNLFYSRRIGRQPQIDIATDGDLDDGVTEHVNADTRTTILGAAKLTGKNKRGFSWALLETLGAKEYAEIDSAGHRNKLAIEPLTNYFVSRAQQDISKGNTVVGAMFTATHREIDEPSLNALHKEAYSAGIDFLHHWRKRKYYFSGKGVWSHVKGSAEAISNTQLSSERFFQRPDNNHTVYDSTRRSLSGTGGQLIVGKKSGNIVADLGVVWQSPGLELNDVGFMAQTDNITQWFWLQYRVQQPKGITRWQRYNVNQWREYDFGFKNLNAGYNVNAHAQFTNYWRVGGGVSYNTHSISNADLRGGPALRYPANMEYELYVMTDTRKKLYAEISNELSVGSNNYSINYELETEFTYRPINALNITISPSFTKNKNQMQYVATSEETADKRYVVAEIDQTIARISFRLTYMFTPNLSLQYWGQPFGSCGNYKNYKLITDARAGVYAQRFSALPTDWISQKDEYLEIDEQHDGSIDYGFDKPDFNFGQFRSNLVVRWEYIPGSTLFVVWNQERTGEFYDTHPGHSDYSLRFTEKAHNIFLIKYTYRFVL
jgi:hypothetical protein